LGEPRGNRTKEELQSHDSVLIIVG